MKIIKLLNVKNITVFLFIAAAYFLYLLSFSSFELYKIDKFNETSKTEEYVLFTPGSVNSYRTLCKHIIPNSITGKITKIVLYTTKELNPKIATDDMHLFKKILQDDLIANITTVVNNDIQGVKLETPFVSSYWQIEGCIPQKVNDEHQALFDNQQLIRLEDY